MKKVSVGEEFEFEKDMDICTVFLDEKKKIKAGDKAVVGVRHIIIKTGEGRGKRLLPSELDLEIDGLDTEGLSDYIYNFMNRSLNLENISNDFELEEYCGLSAKNIKSAIFDALDEIL